MTPDERFVKYHTAQYLRRLIGARNFPAPMLADDTLKVCLQELESESISQIVDEGGRLLEDLPRRSIDPVYRIQLDRGLRRLFLKFDSALDALSRRLRPKAGQALVAGKIARLASMLELDAVESELLRFYAVSALDGLLKEVTEDLGLASMRANYPRFLAQLTGAPAAEIKGRIGFQARLHRLGILETQDNPMDRRNPPSLTSLVQKILSSERTTPDNLLESLYRREPGPELDADDFSHLGPAVTLAVRLLGSTWKAKTRGVNILLHGDPGMGKTQFARLVAKLAQATPFAVPQRDDDDDIASNSSRRLSYAVFQRMSAGAEHPLLIVDEADGLLTRADPIYRGGPLIGETGDRKAWLTEALTGNPVPVVWIVNHPESLHDAVKRRFALAVHFPEPTQEVGRRIWSRVMRKAPPRFRLSALEVEALQRTFDLSPGHIQRAVDTWVQATGRRPAAVGELHEILAQSLRLARGEEPRLSKLRALDERYDPLVLELKGDLGVEQMSRAIRQFYARPGAGPGAFAQAAFLFHGPSGAGKTELAKYLAEQAGRPLQCERMSDLQSMYVGECEKNLAQAFTRAARQRSVLLLDEFDSLGFDRTKAVRSWEVSQTNELLQQLENFSGVLIACTNLVTELDAALSRRFAFKVGFTGIRRERRAEAVTRYFADVLRDQTLNAELHARLDALPSLYPGDLRAVRMRFAAQMALGQGPDAAAVVVALADEAAFRKTERRPIGFGERPPSLVRIN